MIIRFLLAVIGGIGLGYGIAHIRYGNTESIRILQDDYKKLQTDHQTLQDHYTQLSAAQELIKVKAKELVAQNQDYAKIVSQLNRYYYQLQDVRENITSLSEKLGSLDPLFENKLESISQQDPLSPPDIPISDTGSEKQLKR